MGAPPESPVGSPARRILLFILMSTALAGWTQSTCSGPPDLTARMRDQPTADNATALGIWYADNRQFDCAVGAFREALKSDPNSAKLHYFEGLALIGGSHPDEAVIALRASSQADPHAIQPHLALADLDLAMNQRADAEAQWRQALAIDPRSEPALEGLSDALLDDEDYAAVIVLLRNADRSEALTINLAKALGKTGYLEDAHTVLTEAMRISPHSVDLARAMTVVLIKMNRSADAIKLLDATRNEHPGVLDVQVDLLRILVHQDQFDRAGAICSQLLTQRSDDPEILQLCGTVDRAAGNYDKAKIHLQAAIAANPDVYDSQYNLGAVLVTLHEWRQAETHLRMAIALDPKAPEVHIELAKALRGLGDPQQAAEEVKTYEQLKKAAAAESDAALAASQGDKEIDKGNAQQAAAAYRQAIEQDPANAVYRYKLSVALRRSGDLAGERAQLEEAIKLDAKLAGAQNQLGYMLAQQGDAAGAVKHFRLAAEAAPSWPEAWINLAAELAATAQYADARTAVAKALTLEPNNQQARELSDQLSKDPATAQPQHQ